MLVNIDNLARNKIKGNGLLANPARNVYDIFHRDEVVFNSVNAKIHTSCIWESQLVLYK